MRGSPLQEQEDGHRRKYTIPLLCPELVVAVTTVTLPVPAQRRLSVLVDYSMLIISA